MMHKYATICEQAARNGGEVLRRMKGKVSVREKAPADLVTEADLASQERIRATLLGAFPSHGFLGEETPMQVGEGDLASEFTWIVDPLDGTTNYVHGLDNYCVSVALVRDRQVLVGAVYDPEREECFTAQVGEGALCNGTPIRCSETKSLDQALVAASLPARVAPGSVEVQRFLHVLYRCQALRRLGSAALNLCYVAAGRLDGYWATSVKTWDVAAGLLVVQEAGGLATALDGDPVSLIEPRFAASSTASLHAELLAVLADATK